MRNLASVTAIILLISSRWGGQRPFYISNITISMLSTLEAHWPCWTTFYSALLRLQICSRHTNL